LTRASAPLFSYLENNQLLEMVVFIPLVVPLAA
jgi:hypothetical protein